MSKKKEQLCLFTKNENIKLSNKYYIRYYKNHKK